jgi:hypothetical protein
MTVRRRDLLRGALCGAATAVVLGGRRPAHAIGKKSKFRITRLVVSGVAAPRPLATRRLAWEIDKRTSIEVDLEGAEVRPSDEALHDHPFLYLAGDQAFTAPDTGDVEALRRYLTNGGFLLVDSAEGRAGGAFDGSVRDLVKEIFPPPEAGLAAVAADHVILKSFYLVDAPVGRVSVAPALEAVIHDGRAVLVYCQNDLGGAWERDNFGDWSYECHPGGEAQREHAFRLGINLAMYALCLDYKTDQVHVPFIMRRRKWRTDE